MRPGTVFRWEKFPFPQYGGPEKARWFIYLGDSGILLDPIMAYICTSTTRIEDFKEGGKKGFLKHYLFKAQSSPFAEECII